MKSRDMRTLARVVGMVIVVVAVAVGLPGDSESAQPPHLQTLTLDVTRYAGPLGVAHGQSAKLILKNMSEDCTLVVGGRIEDLDDNVLAESGSNVAAMGLGPRQQFELYWKDTSKAFRTEVIGVVVLSRGAGLDFCTREQIQTAGSLQVIDNRTGRTQFLMPLEGRGGIPAYF